MSEWELVFAEATSGGFLSLSFVYGNYDGIDEEHIFLWSMLGFGSVVYNTRTGEFHPTGVSGTPSTTFLLVSTTSAYETTIQGRRCLVRGCSATSLFWARPGVIVSFIDDPHAVVSVFVDINELTPFVGKTILGFSGTRVFVMYSRNTSGTFRYQYQVGSGDLNSVNYLALQPSIGLSNVGADFSSIDRIDVAPQQDSQSGSRFFSFTQRQVYNHPTGAITAIELYPDGTMSHHIAGEVGGINGVISVPLPSGVDVIDAGVISMGDLLFVSHTSSNWVNSLGTVHHGGFRSSPPTTWPLSGQPTYASQGEVSRGSQFIASAVGRNNGLSQSKVFKNEYINKYVLPGGLYMEKDPFSESYLVADGIRGIAFIDPETGSSSVLGETLPSYAGMNLQGRLPAAMSSSSGTVCSPNMAVSVSSGLGLIDVKNIAMPPDPVSNGVACSVAGIFEHGGKFIMSVSYFRYVGAEKQNTSYALYVMDDPGVTGDTQSIGYIL